jgi:murein DD-endopeptidase MepM/ murein hydrolase activator NlpD/SH3-like domain-containing protein
MRYLLLLFILMGLYGCNGGVVDRLLKKQSPYENYLSSLESTSLRDYALVQDWKTAGEQVLNDSLEVSLPYQEIGYFDPKEPRAMLLRYPVKEGHQINVTLDPLSQKDAVFFLDIFEVDPSDSSLERIHYADSLGMISYSARSSGIHALRLQPELFRGGMFSLSITVQGVLAFPIVGKGTRNIASFWGDPRDGDARKHEGVDVFANRGTPVVAASRGRVRRVGNNRLGGKVVWLANNEYGHSQYYAHLDSQLVSVGQLVDVGDTIGLVGNSGNAITTAPHLHFGIYRSGRGAVDPFPFLQELVLPTETAVADSVDVGRYAIVTAPLANVRDSPTTSSAKAGSYQQNTLVQIEGKSGSWFRISLPNRQKGYIFENLVRGTTDALQEVQLTPLDEISEDWDASSPLSGYLIAGNARVLGEFEGSYFLETAAGIKGWWRFE